MSSSQTLDRLQQGKEKRCRYFNIVKMTQHSLVQYIRLEGICASKSSSSDNPPTERDNDHSEALLHYLSLETVQKKVTLCLFGEKNRNYIEFTDESHLNQCSQQEQLPFRLLFL